MYQILKSSVEPIPSCVRRLCDGALIPFHADNTDYQAYLKWLDGYELVCTNWVKKSEGNTPLPADEVGA